MSIDNSLRLKGQLVRQRNVLTRSQRLEELERQGRWKEGDSPLGLPKVRVFRVKKRAKKKEEEKETPTPVAAPAPAPSP